MKKGYNYLDKILSGEATTWNLFDDGSRIIEINGYPIFGYCRYISVYKDLLSLLPLDNDKKHIVEVGSFLGQSSAIMAYFIQNSIRDDIVFDCVDLFEISDFSDDKHGEYIEEHANGDFYGTFIKNMEKTNSLNYINKIHKATSLEAAALYENNSLDFVMLDASHKYEDVIDDIVSWWPKLKEGGILAGDDWDHSGVRKAVIDCFGEKNIDGVTPFATWFTKKVSTLELLK